MQITLLIQMRWLFHWRKQYFGLWTGILKRSNGLKLKTLWWISFLQTCSVSLHKMLIDGLEWCGLRWCFYQLFGLSFWRHPFTAEDPLVNKWWNATLIQICSEEIKSTSGMTWGWVNHQQIFIFGWTIPLNNIGIDVAYILYPPWHL